MREALETEFAEEFTAQSEGMNRGQALRLKHKLKDTAKFQRLNCLHNPIKEALIKDIQSLYSDFYFPK